MCCCVRDGGKIVFFSQEFSANFCHHMDQKFECQSLKVTEKIAKDIFIVKNLSLSHNSIT